MRLSLEIDGRSFWFDTSKPLDLSIPLQSGKKNPIAWYQGAPKISPVVDGDFVGQVSLGSSTNFYNITFNPHAHGTHTECVGHISPDFRSVNEHLQEHFFWTRLLSITPETRGGDQIITKAQIAKYPLSPETKAVAIRTLPNDLEKLTKNYSHTNWPYLSQEAAVYLRDRGVDHLLIDLPSVDKEKDQGALLAHKAFWNYPDAPRYHATITEMIFVADHIKDGDYLLNLQVAPFHNDASPSRPILLKPEL